MAEKRTALITYEFVRTAQGLLEADLQRMPAARIDYAAHSQKLAEQLGHDQKRVLDAFHEIFPQYLLNEGESPKALADSFLSRTPMFARRMRIETLVERIKKQGGIGETSVNELAGENNVDPNNLLAALRAADVPTTVIRLTEPRMRRRKKQVTPLSKKELVAARKENKAAREERTAAREQRYKELLEFIERSVQENSEIANKKLFMKVAGEVFRATKAQEIARRFGIDELAVIAVRNRLNGHLSEKYLSRYSLSRTALIPIIAFRKIAINTTRFYDTYTDSWTSSENRRYASGKGILLALMATAGALKNALKNAFKNQPKKVQTIARTRKALPKKPARLRATRRMP